MANVSTSPLSPRRGPAAAATPAPAETSAPVLSTPVIEPKADRTQIFLANQDRQNPTWHMDIYAEPGETVRLILPEGQVRQAAAQQINGYGFEYQGRPVWSAQVVADITDTEGNTRRERQTFASPIRNEQGGVIGFDRRPMVDVTIPENTKEIDYWVEVFKSNGTAYIGTNGFQNNPTIHVR